MDYIGIPLDVPSANRTPFRPVSDLQFVDVRSYKKQFSPGRFEKHTDHTYQFSDTTELYRYADSYDDQYNTLLVESNGFGKLSASAGLMGVDPHTYNFNSINVGSVTKAGTIYTITFSNGSVIKVDIGDADGDVESVLNKFNISLS